MVNRFLFMLFFIFTIIPVKADFNFQKWHYYKNVFISGQGIGRIKLDAEVYNHSKPDLSDIRVVNLKGSEIPYKINVHRDYEKTEKFFPHFYNLSHLPGQYTVFYLDFGKEPPIINSINIRTPNRNFKRRVEIWGSDNAKKWLMIRNNAYIFNFHTQDYTTSYTEIKIPDTKRRYLKILIWNNKEKTLKIKGCNILRRTVIKAKKDVVSSKIILQKEDKEKKRSEIIIDSEHNNVPKSELTFYIPGTQLFYRIVLVSGADDMKNWHILGSDIIYRYNNSKEKTNISFKETGYRYIKVWILNEDNQPLPIRKVAVMGYPREILFFTKPDEKYLLFYGNLDAKRPIYDIEKLLPYMESARITGKIGKEKINIKFNKVYAFFKNNRALLLYPVVILLIIFLGWIMVNSIKKIKETK